MASELSFNSAPTAAVIFSVKSLQARCAIQHSCGELIHADSYTEINYALSLIYAAMKAHQASICPNRVVYSELVDSLHTAFRKTDIPAAKVNIMSLLGALLRMACDRANNTASENVLSTITTLFDWFVSSQDTIIQDLAADCFKCVWQANLENRIQLDLLRCFQSMLQMSQVSHRTKQVIWELVINHRNDWGTDLLADCADTLLEVVIHIPWDITRLIEIKKWFDTIAIQGTRQELLLRLNKRLLLIKSKRDRSGKESCVGALVGWMLQDQSHTNVSEVMTETIFRGFISSIIEISEIDETDSYKGHPNSQKGIPLEIFQTTDQDKRLDTLFHLGRAHKRNANDASAILKAIIKASPNPNLDTRVVAHYSLRDTFQANDTEKMMIKTLCLGLSV
ncbi:hypothetical protein HOH87_02575 [bacterium]|jgi:hypothetical protein|nr:hypothetical protein [bacterium]